MEGKHIVNANEATIEALHKKLAIDVHTNIIYVDGTLGNNTQAASDASIPYKTLTAAKIAATPGQLIIVFPGTYEENDLLKDGVNWHFMPGANIAVENVSDYVIFDDKGSAVSCIISGLADLSIKTLAGESNLIMGAINLAHSDSNIIAEFNTIYGECTDSAQNSRAVTMQNGKLKLTANKIHTPYLENGSGAIDFHNGDLTLSVNELIGDNVIFGYGSGNINADINSIVFVTNALYNGSTNVNLVVRARIGKITDSGFGIAFYMNNELHAIVDNCNCILTSSSPSSDYYLNVNRIKVTDPMQAIISADGGKFIINCKRIETNGQLISNNSANIILHCDYAELSGDVDQVIGTTGDQTKLSGTIKITQERPLIKSAQTGQYIFDGLKIIVPDTQSESVGDLVAPLIAYSSYTNKPVNVGTTVSGDLTVGSYVI